ncbi:MAG: NosD domain-containing protein [Haloarculaceae archaeon]
MDVRIAASLVFAVLLVASGAFLVGPSSGRVHPVEFHETLAMGMTGVDVGEARERGYALPRAQVFYRQYRYVVGYYGVEPLVTHLQSGVARRQFGEPLAVFVREFSGSDPSLVDGGYLDVGNEPGLGWVRARDASFVVGSRARTPAGPTVVPFETRDDARAFADEYGGRVLTWSRLRSSDLAGSGTAVETFRAAVENRSEWADGVVQRRRSLRDRPVSVVVGEDAPTLSAAVEAAPPNTTVLVPPGRYGTNVTVEKPVTIRGSGPDTTLDGGGNGTVVTLRADRSALVSASVVGVGSVGVRSPDEGNASRWADRTMLVYGRSDAGVLLAGANESLVADVRVDTPATGVLVRHSDRSVVRDVTVVGTNERMDGLMGVMPMYSRVVIEDATVRGGRDGVYTHRAHGSVLRDSRLSDQRYGVHEMFTSEMLVRNVTARDSEVGIMLMTRPSNNLVVDNAASGCQIGILSVGDASYVAGNVVYDNEVGLTVGTTRSVVTRNTAVDNGVGLKAATLMPTNRVFANDVVGNDEPVTASGGPLHVWTSDGTGNYWGSAPGLDRDGDGRLDRPFRPSARIDVATGRVAGGPTLARAPALVLRRHVAGTLPGLRDRGLVDLGPLADPVRPDVLETVRNTTHD